MNLKLFIKKSENVNEFFERTKLTKLLNLVTIIAFILWAFFRLFTKTPFARLIPQIVLNPNQVSSNPLTLFDLFNILFMILSIGLLVFKLIFQKWLNEDYAKFRSEIEGNETIFKEYESFYFKRVKTYIDVNGAFFLNKSETKVNVGYKRNTTFAMVIVITIFIVWILSLIYTNLDYIYTEILHDFSYIPENGMILDLWKMIKAITGFILILYIYYVINRSKKFKENYINVTIDELRNDNYNSKWDENYLDYMNNNSTLNKRAKRYYNMHCKGWLKGLFCTKEDTLIFGIEIFCAFIYLVAVYYIFLIIFRIFISFSPELETKYNNHVLKKQEKNDRENVQKRLVLVGRGWNEYYEIDDKYIREGLGTPYGRYTGYEIHGNEIWYQKDGQWKTMGIISRDGSCGSVMYSNDYDGDKIFQRYEWK